MHSTQQYIIEKLVVFAESLNIPTDGIAEACFVLEQDIIPTRPLTVDYHRVVPPEEFARFVSYIESGAGWVHANLQRTPAGECIISLHRGRLCGNPNLSLNISIDPHPWHIRQ